MAEKLVLIAGATGQIGGCVARHFLDRSGWNLAGLSRRPQRGGEFPMLAVDMLDAADCREKLAGVPEITHLVYAARHDHTGGEQESADTNLRMLANLLAAIGDRPGLSHVHLVHGTKYYGHTLGPRPVPYREDAQRHDGQLFYYPQQDLLIQQNKGRAWNWSISRPHTFCDLNVAEPRSITLLVAIYASILKEQGLPLRFPGTRRAFEARTQFTWLPMLARSIEWMITDPDCANQAFNVVNDDARSWSTLWPDIADYFGMDWSIGEPETMATYPDAHAGIWNRMVSGHGLRSSDLRTVVQWPYADYVFSPQWDVVSSMEKARKYGFTEKIDTTRMWRDSFDFYRTRKIVP
ncbi:NAD-dependent epimerase/dehydratase family protein [Bordetella sp. BOR01]|uniref:NAD-dependent epimerase/dehydratase family protein n=1 Tax=Bordetella sp. BOR01 TaxID=2854779 RepID=UPI001C44A7D6|nr:NAD-dependent epimerase/dehydratase family protein [Bordetella sp. BOR01]MBV7483778.1 NAD-dependent epimerase/dehydratase family protein [Bordetella sp. BOR01]